MTRDTHVPLTREGAVGALKLLMIVLAAATFWNAGHAVNQEFHARSLVTATPFMRGAARLFLGAETTAGFEQRLMEFWAANHRAVALTALLAATVLLVARYLVMGRLIDYLYLESEARDRRIYSGFVANIFVTLLHAGAAYGLVVVGNSSHAPMVPGMLIALLLINLLWIAVVLATAKPPERGPLRGLKYMLLTSGAALIVLFALAWRMEARVAADDVKYGSQMMILTAAVATALCIADAWVQSAIYLPRRKTPVPAA